MTFEEWWESTDLDPITPRDAWNAALEEAAQAVEFIDAIHAAFRPAAIIRALEEKP